MAYLLGSQAVMESLQSDVLDLQAVIAEILSRVGPVSAQSWKFPDKSAAEVDVDDLLDLYDCSGESDDAEERQVAHIALYELVIDRLIYCIQSLSKFSVTHLGASLSGAESDNTGNTEISGSVGVIVKDHWCQMTKLQTLYHQLQSQTSRDSSHKQTFSSKNKISELENSLRKLSSEENMESGRRPSPSVSGTQLSYTGPPTPGMLGIIPPNTSDRIIMGLSPSTGELQISKDCYSKNTQTYETSFVACESCDIVQRRMREAGEVVIRVCTEQGLPCSLKKFKSQLSNFETIPYNDLCRWMVEQNKDVSRIGKQIDILQETINPLKNDLKGCEKRTRLAEEKAKDSVKLVKEEKEVQSVLRKQLEKKLLDQEKKQQEEIWEAERQKQTLQQKLEKQEKDLTAVRGQLEDKEEILQDLEKDCQRLKTELKEKVKEAKKSSSQSEELTRLQDEINEVRGQLEETRKSLSREQGKHKNISKNNQSLQTKQENLLFRMETLGRENEELAGQVNSLEEEKISLEDKLAELKVETKQLRKKSKEKEVIIKNLNKEKVSLEASIAESQKCLQRLQTEVEEAKERERMIIEYPDLNGPVNTQLQGRGNIVEDMSNQVKANTIRISVLTQQNHGLAKSIRKIQNMAEGSGNQVPNVDSQMIQQIQEHNTPDADNTLTAVRGPLHTPVEPVSLWQHTSAVSRHGEYTDNNYVKTPDPEAGGPPPVKHHYWTCADEERRKPPNVPVKDLAMDFVVGRTNTPVSSRHKNKTKRSDRPSSAKMASIMAPVNATPIGAYTQMKQALGILSSKNPNKQGGHDVQALGIDFTTKKGRPPSGRHQPTSCPVSVPTDNRPGHSDIGENTTYSCPKCDKMYMKSRDLDIHLTYCAT